MDTPQILLPSDPHPKGTEIVIGLLAYPYFGFPYFEWLPQDFPTTLPRLGEGEGGRRLIPNRPPPPQ